MFRDGDRKPFSPAAKRWLIPSRWRALLVCSGLVLALCCMSLLASTWTADASQNFFWRNFTLRGTQASAQAASDEISLRFPAGSDDAGLARFLSASGARCARDASAGREWRVCRFVHDNPLIPMTLVDWRISVPIAEGRVLGGYAVTVALVGP